MDELRDGKRTKQNGNQRRSKVSQLRTGKGLRIDGDRCHLGTPFSPPLTHEEKMG